MKFINVLIYLSYYSRKISGLIFGVYLILLVFLNGSVFNNKLPDIFINIFFLLSGVLIGLNLMAWIVGFLNKKEVVESETFQKINGGSKKNNSPSV